MKKCINKFLPIILVEYNYSNFSKVYKFLKKKYSCFIYDLKSNKMILLKKKQIQKLNKGEILEDTFKKNNNGVNYTIQWYNCKKNKTETSHFYGNTLEEILNKFYFEKSRKTTIFLVKLNPES